MYAIGNLNQISPLILRFDAVIRVPVAGRELASLWVFRYRAARLAGEDANESARRTDGAKGNRRESRTLGHF